MKHIVLVEDDLWLGELYVALLSGNDFSVNWQRDAYAALDAIDDRRPDVLVLDMWLPGANGIQLLQEIASHSDLVGIPVVLCSNEPPKLLSAEVLAAYGVVAVVTKSTSSPNHFLQTVQEAAEHHANVSY